MTAEGRMRTEWSVIGKYGRFKGAPIKHPRSIPHSAGLVQNILHETIYTINGDDQILLSIKSVNCDLVNAPTLVASTSPSLKIINVGIPLTP